MATLLRGEAPVILQPAGTAQYKGAYCPPNVPFKEVRRGPFDGRADIVVRLGINGEVPKLLTLGDGAVVYEHDGRDAKGRVVYRYAPKLSSGHRGLMDGVAEVYAENARKGEQR